MDLSRSFKGLETYLLFFRHKGDLSLYILLQICMSLLFQGRTLKPTGVQAPEFDCPLNNSSISQFHHFHEGYPAPATLPRHKYRPIYTLWRFSKFSEEAGLLYSH